MKRSEILANRQKWIDYLKRPNTKKAKNLLDRGNGRRCCLGHGCHILGIKKSRSPNGVFVYENEYGLAPKSFAHMVGLHGSHGAAYLGVMVYGKRQFVSLTDMNDNTNYSPQKIGEYLESVIEGGPNTPFRPLSDYPE